METKDTIRAVLAGFLMMILEVGGARLLYPHFGSSMVIWAAIIGMFMLVLSIGYYLGGRMSAEKNAEPKVAALLAAGGLLAISLPFLVSLATLAPLSWQPLLALTALLISLPGLALSVVSPVLIEKVNKNHAGKASGAVYAVSTVGSIAGTFFAAFFLLPNIGVASTIALAGALMIVLAALFHSSTEKFIPIAAVLFLTYLIANPFGIPTYFYTADIVDKDGVRYLFLDDWANSGLNLSNYSSPVFIYSDAMKEKMRNMSDVQRVAMIGAGGCTQVHHVLDVFPEAKISIVDIDSKLFEICSAKFYVNESKQVKFFSEDGRKFLERSGQFDMMIVDAFSSGCQVPQHIASSEFFQLAANSLSKNGTLMLNVIVNRNSGSQQVFCNTVKSAFEKVDCVPLGNKSLVNLVIAASGKKQGAQGISEGIITDDKNPIEASYGFECVS